MDELFAALDKLKAAGIVPLAHGGQAWQETILFSMVLANMGGRELYLRVIRDRDQARHQLARIPQGAAGLQAPVNPTSTRPRRAATGTTPPRW
jgi:glucose/mannose transport system substrate-binding protein